jgi:methylenetetrahydrofolate--tRNA-(uracil-5-)-methyltransferase
MSIVCIPNRCKFYASSIFTPGGRITVAIFVPGEHFRMTDLTVIGGGLAGCEAAWQAAEKGLRDDLFEMRPLKMTGAHTGAGLAELVCSNSLGSNLPDRASGMLKNELRLLNSMLLRMAEQSALPAGGALAVDREIFSQTVTTAISNHPNIHLIRSELTDLPSGPVIVASGPLTSPSLVNSIQAFTGQERLFFFDAIAPVVTAESIDMEIAFRASRYGQGDLDEGDYLNCPLDKDQYTAFVQALRTAERIELREFETEIPKGVSAGLDHFFEGCLPVEILAERSEDALAFGPMRPIGIKVPKTRRWAHALVQLRQDNLAASLYNMVGFQTNLTYSEQRRVLRMIPGLEHAEFARFGQMHRNTFIASPILLHPSLQSRQSHNLFFAGQITGVEGYMGNIATGLLAGLNAARLIQGQELLIMPKATMLGALCHYITHASMQDFQPTKSMFGILPPLENAPRSRKERSGLHVERGFQAMNTWMSEYLKP